MAATLNLKRFISNNTPKTISNFLYLSRFSNPSSPSINSLYSSRIISTSRTFCSKPTDYNPVNATVITGFLGSGKTNLLNHILTSQHGKRIAVIKNECGVADTNGSLAASSSSANEDIVMVNNGCLCCTVRGDLGKMLLELVKKRRDKFDHIVIESTGLAKHGPVIETVCTDELVSRHVKLDGVVTLVDCKHAMQHLKEALEQVPSADRIILNKIDLVNDDDIEAITKKIKNINAKAQIQKAKMGWSTWTLCWEWEDMILTESILMFLSFRGPLH